LYKTFVAKIQRGDEKETMIIGRLQQEIHNSIRLKDLDVTGTYGAVAEWENFVRSKSIAHSLDCYLLAGSLGEV
jgi:hypothetical protein